LKLKAVGEKKILYVMAAEPEYGPNLKARIEPLMTGIGPVEAAVQLSRALTELSRDQSLPDLIVSLGSAGSAKFMQGNIYQVSSVSYRDMDASPLGFEKGRTPLLDLPGVVDMPLQIPGIEQASLSTGANIISGVAYDLIDAEMVDMESFAILRAAMAFGVPMIGLRGISDGAKELTHLGDWTEYLHVVDERLAVAVDLLETALVAGELI
jgi:adenosylhomocysteine nucleosidase